MKICLLFLLSTLSLLPFFCLAQSAKGYIISGEIRGLANGSKVYLIHGGQLRLLDSATVQQGRFALRGHLAEPAHTYLHAGRGRTAKKLADILLDNSEILVKGNKPDYDSITVGGSVIDQQWKLWFQEDAQIGRHRYQIRQVQQSLLARNDTANARTLRKLIGEMQASRVRLLKSYVQRYHDTAAGAALPTLCTLEATLTGPDYLEMYRTLTPTWQQSTFGKEIISQATKKGSALPR
jgi:Domain of unknown function (DUF4369)